MPAPHSGGEVNRPGVERISSDTLSAVWEEAYKDLLRVTLALGVRSDRADDLLQDVWLTAWQKAPGELDGQALRRWLYRVLVNRCRLEHRARGRWRRAWEVLSWVWTPVGVNNASDGARSKELRTEVEKALATLDSSVREIVVLRYFCDFDSRQIGEMLEMPDSTVRSHLRTARQQLARMLADWKDHYES